ncbi:MAG TPA: quinol:electron acceptor oxidoreductase subunit ActD [Kofleriaceae bacterium]|nr:quinol:electron acceptor oxidoreductase subunit ActD [Kofleriaceae bacterium]
MATEHTTSSADDNEPDYGDGELYGVLAEYDTPGELIEAARRVRDAGYTEFDCFSPFPVHGIDDAMGIKRTILPLFIFGGGFAGTLGGILLQWWCNAYNWPWNISGKPTWSIPANVPIAFETTILLAVFTSFFGMWIMNKLPQVWHPFFRLERFGRATDDAFLLGIEAKDERFDVERTTALLKEAGAIAVEPCYLEADPARRTMPRWITAFIVASTAFALIPFAIAAKARNSHSNEPHIHIFPDMDFQPKFKPDTAADMFADGRANRGELPGTVARGSLYADDLFYRGIENGQWTQGFPKQLEINEALLRRGKERFEIYCTPCHGFDGRGEGTVPKRVAQYGGAWQARNLVEAPNDKGVGGVVVKMPNGQLFNTISNGFNTMMGYAAQIPHADRWAIVLYVRSLQRASNATLEDVPENERNNMMSPQAPQPAPAAGSGAKP